MDVLGKALAHGIPIVPRPVLYRIARNYIAGETLEDAIRSVRDLNVKGISGTVDLLGERIKTKQAALEALDEYKSVLDALAREGLRSGISVKLTALGLALDEDMCRDNLIELVQTASRLRRFVRVDMEDSPYTEATLKLVLEVHREYQNVGAVLQAYLRRSLEDARRLTAAGISVRLCKGIYIEPAEIAYKDYDAVRANYVLLMQELLQSGVYTAIATHDEFLVSHALRLVHELGIPKERYEFQMLLGVRERLRDTLVNEGHRMRVYVPYGRDWYAYSTRRLQENPKIAAYVASGLLKSIVAR